MVGATGWHIYHALGAAKPNHILSRPEAEEILLRLRTRVTNARCYLDESETDSERRAGFEKCAEHLQEEMDAMPEVRCVLAVGGDASWLLTGRSNMMKLHGSVWTRREVEAMVASRPGPQLRLPPRVHTVVCVYHPSFAMHGFPQAWNGIYRVIKRALMWAMREQGPSRDFQFFWVPPASLTPKLSIDIETPMSEPYTIKLVGVAPLVNEAYIFPPMGNRGAIEYILESGSMKIGHNWAYDHKAFLANGFEVADPIWNTIDAENLLRPPTGKALARRWFSLYTCCQHWLDDWPYHKESSDPMTKVWYRASFPNIPDSLHEELYCGLDCIGTRRLQVVQEKVLAAAGML